MATTDHSEQITGLRWTADRLERMNRTRQQRSVALTIVRYRAVADLLEIHDATGLNLHQAPGLLAFVEMEGGEGVGEFKVEDNLA